jgi:hypothetical protein
MRGQCAPSLDRSRRHNPSRSHSEEANRLRSSMTPFECSNGRLSNPNIDVILMTGCGRFQKTLGIASLAASGVRRRSAQEIAEFVAPRHVLVRRYGHSGCIVLGDSVHLSQWTHAHRNHWADRP